MCKVKGCSNPPVARGLCAKHYMRKRRTGSPNTAPRKAGRPRIDNPERAALLADFLPLASRRTRYRFLLALRLLVDVLGVGDTEGGRARRQSIFQEIIRRATRPGGSLNVAEVERLVERLAAERESDEFK